MRGIILAGGTGTRLYPLTRGISKQLMPIYDKPLIYYPLSVLMLAKIKDVQIITTPEDQSNFKRLLGDGSELGMRFSYTIQHSPEGIAQAFLLAEDFIGDENVCLILGDNIYYGHNLTSILSKALTNVEIENKATIFGYHVTDPERYGVADFDSEGNVKSIHEKPIKPKSNFAVTGLYFYPNDVIQKSKLISPSERGELEITEVNQIYLSEQRLKLEIMGRGYTWLDAGTHQSLLEASQFVETIERRQGLKIACLEELAYKQGYISKEKLIELAQPLKNNEYGKYLIQCINEVF